ncbi:hypothetical protein IIV22A_060R [Invertebrate iridescent virus 22]|uniref:Uncharacterized protein n=1 Tax=Invertebrate iridescent virus 22 TaxID=345198 RepID=W8W2P6_9VIRU|nr:hypothetical protein IIV22A_060R [Invertebrate iridescent virus 22]CCV01904.1 hypothetical protein IIV22A_060R [Invertebrate iridescent virus 22]
MAEPMYYLDYLFCCQFTTNNIIIDLLEDLATKKRKCIISSRLKSYNGDYHKLYIDVLKYFKIKDKTNKEIEENKIKNWSSIRKKTMKDLILKNYIIEIKYKYLFDETTLQNLKRELMIGLNFKNVNDKNIIIKNNKISSILGLNLGINTYSWDYDIFSYN